MLESTVQLPNATEEDLKIYLYLKISLQVKNNFPESWAFFLRFFIRETMTDMRAYPKTLVGILKPLLSFTVTV